MISEMQKYMQNGVSRRSFLQTLGAASAAAVTIPAMAYGQTQQAAGQQARRGQGVATPTWARAFRLGRMW